MVLGGRVNKGLVSLIQQSGGAAVGLCGKDSDIIRARQMVEKEIGFVGEVTSVNPSLIQVGRGGAGPGGGGVGPDVGLVWWGVAQLCGPRFAGARTFCLGLGVGPAQLRG